MIVKGIFSKNQYNELAERMINEARDTIFISMGYCKGGSFKIMLEKLVDKVLKDKVDVYIVADVTFLKEKYKMELDIFSSYFNILPISMELSKCRFFPWIHYNSYIHSKVLMVDSKCMIMGSKNYTDEHIYLDDIHNTIIHTNSISFNHFRFIEFDIYIEFEEKRRNIHKNLLRMFYKEPILPYIEYKDCKFHFLYRDIGSNYLIEEILKAKNEVLICNCQFWTFEELYDVVDQKVKDGVSFKVLTDHSNYDITHILYKLYYYQLQNGIHLAKMNTNRLNHCKFMIIDRETLIISTNSYNKKNLKINVEHNFCIILDKSVARELIYKLCCIFDSYEYIQKQPSYTITNILLYPIKKFFEYII